MHSTKSQAFKPKVLLLSLAIAAAVAACSKPDPTPAPTASTDAPPPTGITLDESKLPPVNRFLVTDLDKSKDACTDFGSYVNDTWLAANPIPGDRTSWGAFEMLAERSTAAQRQLAEQAAAVAIDRFIGDLGGRHAQGVAQGGGEGHGRVRQAGESTIRRTK